MCIVVDGEDIRQRLRGSATSARTSSRTVPHTEGKLAADYPTPLSVAGHQRMVARGKRLGRPQIAPELEAPHQEGPGDSWETSCARHAKRFGVDPGTVQRISRPFDGGASAVVSFLGPGLFAQIRPGRGPLGTPEYLGPIKADSLAQKRADALLVAPQVLFSTRRVQLVTLAARHAVPTILLARVCRSWRTDKLRVEYCRSGAPARRLRRPHSQGREAGRPAGPTPRRSALPSRCRSSAKDSSTPKRGKS